VSPIYWLDAGVLISAHRGVYTPELVPGFWGFIEAKLRDGTLRMPKMCFEEITDGNDWLAKWCKGRRNIGYFCVKACDHSNVEDYQKIIAQFVYENNSYASAADFLKGGDSWVMAFALATGGYAVTEETTKKYKTKVKIRLVAKAKDVPFRLTCKNTREMCIELKARFG
jgi:hypothetical protein